MRKRNWLEDKLVQDEDVGSAWLNDVDYVAPVPAPPPPPPRPRPLPPLASLCERKDPGEREDGALSVQHPCDFDDTVRFIEEGHTYQVRHEDGGWIGNGKQRVIMSVTGLLDEYVSTAFDSEFISGMVVRKRLETYQCAVQASASDRSRSNLLYQFGPELGGALADDADFKELVSAAEAKYGGRTSKGKACANPYIVNVARAVAEHYGPLVAAQFGELTPEAERAKWGRATALGTYVHAQIHRYYNCQPYDCELHEMKLFFEVLRTTPALARKYAWRSEVSMALPDRFITGQADLVTMSPRAPARKIVWDWKCVKDIRASKGVSKEFSQAFPGFKKTKEGVYGIQLNMYRRMLEFAGHEVEAMYIVELHKDHEGERVMPVRFMDAEVDWLLERRERALGAMVMVGAG